MNQYTGASTHVDRSTHNPATADPKTMHRAAWDSCPIFPHHSNTTGARAGQMDGHSAMTLDEPVWHTVKRDLLQVGSKLQVVLLPRENQDGVLKKLKDCECGGGALVGE